MNPHPVLMGKPGTSWSYMVEPRAPLYPRKRLIVCTEKHVLYDGPNPDWHGMFPISRLQLDPWPWLFLGLALAHDLMPMQDGINEIFNRALNTFALTANRGQIADANAMPESQFRPRPLAALTSASCVCNRHLSIRKQHCPAFAARLLFLRPTSATNRKLLCIRPRTPSFKLKESFHSSIYP